MTLRRPPQPGYDPLDAAAEAGEEMRLDEAGDDAHVRLRQLAVDEGGSAVAHRAELCQRVLVFGFVIEHAVMARDLRREHFFQFRRGIGPVGAELVEQGDVLGRHAGQIFQQPGDQAVIGRGARQVGEGDANVGAGLDPLAQREGGDRVIQCGKDGAALIGQAGTVRGFDDGDGSVGQGDGQMALAVS